MDRIQVLRAFVRLVEKGSFTSVANELRVKQSTVSKWVAALEDELGVPLLDRTTRAMRVTDAGRRFHARAAAVVDAYDAAVADAREDGATLRGRIRLSLPVVFGRRFVLPLVTGFLDAHPEIEAELVFGDGYVNLVDQGFDLAVRIGVPVDSSLRSHALAESRRRLVAAPRYLAARGAPESPADLATHDCLRHTELDARTVWTFRRDGESHRVSVRGRVTANHSEATLEMARAGLGICLLARWLVDDDVAAGRLVPLLSPYEPTRAPVRALTPPGRRVPPRVRALIDHIREGLS